MSPSRTTTLHVSAPASALLDLLVELGHLDDVRLGRVNDQLLDLDENPISLDALRRIAAGVLFDDIDSLIPDQRAALEHDWSLLFH